jgi:hypothetical protein
VARATRQQYLLVDPTTQPLATMFHGAPRLSDLTHKRLGLIDDSKENAQELLEEITAVLRQRFGIPMSCIIASLQLPSRRRRR